MGLADIVVLLVVLLLIGGSFALKALRRLPASSLKSEQEKDMQITAGIASRWLAFFGIVLGIGIGIEIFVLTSGFKSAIVSFVPKECIIIIN